MSPAPSLSQHPVDRLIRELIATNRVALLGEVAQIVERMATVAFIDGFKSVRVAERGTSYQGIVLDRRMDSLSYHLVKRVIMENQWAVGTTAEQYVADLHAASRHPQARLTVFHRRGGDLAATITPTLQTLRVERQGEGLLPWLLVIYSADRGKIVTGYQFSRFAETNIPEEARWLR